MSDQGPECRAMYHKLALNATRIHLFELSDGKPLHVLLGVRLMLFVIGKDFGGGFALHSEIKSLRNGVTER